VDANGRTSRVGHELFYVPGSILRVRVDPTMPLAYGFRRDVDVFFDDDPVFRVAGRGGIEPARVAWFDSAAPLRSGWAWGQRMLEGTAAIVDAPIGRGRALLFGPEITFRGQAHGTFKFLFNGIYYPLSTTVAAIGD
jgi:hypothetical protein